jgi:hypothetical protein
MKNEERLTMAFDTAYAKLNISKLVEVEDILQKPDQKCIQLYVSYWYEKLSNIEVHTKTEFSDIVQKVIDFKNQEAMAKLSSEAEILFETLTNLEIEFDTVQQLIETMIMPIVDFETIYAVYTDQYNQNNARITKEKG